MENVLEYSSIYSFAANADQSEFLKMLNDEGVKYIVIGSSALEAHGIRGGKDLDLLVDGTVENSKKIYDVLDDFFGGISGDSYPEMFSDGKSVSLGSPYYGIEIKTNIPGGTYGKIINDCVELEIGGVPATVPSLESLLFLKEFSKRPKDLLDIDLISNRVRKSASDDSNNLTLIDIRKIEQALSTIGWLMEGLPPSRYKETLKTLSALDRILRIIMGRKSKDSLKRILESFNVDSVDKNVRYYMMEPIDILNSIFE